MVVEGVNNQVLAIVGKERMGHVLVFLVLNQLAAAQGAQQLRPTADTHHLLAQVMGFLEFSGVPFVDGMTGVGLWMDLISVD